MIAQISRRLDEAFLDHLCDDQTPDHLTNCPDGEKQSTDTLKQSLQDILDKNFEELKKKTDMQLKISFKVLALLGIIAF